MYYTEQHEHVGDHDRGEQLQKILNPEMHHPEAPEISCREVRTGMCEQTNPVKRGNRQSRKEEEPGHIAHVVVVESPAKPTKQDSHPEKKADREQNLPESPQIEVLKPLVAKPEPGILEPSFDSGILAK